MTSHPSSRHLLDLLREQAAATPDAPAVITTTERWTYREWLANAERVAAALAADGVGPGDTVGLLAPSGPWWLAVAFGTVAVGARLAPFTTWTRGPELDYLLGFVRPKVLFTVPGWARQDFLAQLREIVPEMWSAPPGAWTTGRVPGLRRLVVLGSADVPGAVELGEWLAADRWDGPPTTPPDDVAFVLFTSGSTARPKGVALAHADLIDNGYEIGERQGLAPGDRLLLAAPLFWSLGSANAMPAVLTHGAALVLMPQFDPSGALDLVEQERCSAIYTLSSMTEALLSDPSFRPDRVVTLRRGLTFGSPADVRKVVQELGVDLVSNLYGATEVYGNCVVSPCDAPAHRRITASGPPLPGVDLQIVDPETGAPCGTGVVGEVQVRGRVTPGYLRSDGGLQSVVDGDGWFATGDLGRLDAEGWFTFTGRRSEMIKTSGINVSPAEVEAVLLDHADVAEAAVTGASDAVRDEEVVAFVRLRTGSAATTEDLRRWVADRAASYKVPRRIVLVEQLPMTPTGKLARRELRARAEGLQP